MTMPTTIQVSQTPTPADLTDELRQITLIDTLSHPGELARQLNAVFGAPITGRLAGYRDPKIAYRWARPDGPVPAREALRRLYASSRIWSEVTSERSHGGAVAWFVAPHPALEGEQPLELMMQGRFAEASAVTAYCHDSPAVQLKSSPADVLRVTGLWHEASLQPILSVIRTLAERFGAPTVALLAGESNSKAAYRWVKNEGRLPTGEAAQKIYGVYRAVIALDEIFPAPSVHAWFVAANRTLGERSPVDVARDGDAQSFIDAADRLLFPLNQVRKNR
jgi:uncharacterized protein (DUF2384 family)